VTNEPTDARENATNEADANNEIATNQPADPRQIVTNEPTDARENTTNEANDARGIVTIEPTADREIATNEPTADDDVGLESPTYMKSQNHNLTNEPALSAPSDGSQAEEIYLAREQERCFTTGGRGSVRAGTGWEAARQEPLPQESGAGREEARQEPRPPENKMNPSARDIAIDANGGDDCDLHEEIDRQNTGEWTRARLARMVALRVENPRELNEGNRREPRQANASRRSLRDWHKSGKPAERPKQRAGHTLLRTTGTSANNVELWVN
jgi:hypothetical protein